jgi:hypothetical protein
MDNKIKHYTATQTIPNMEFKPLLRGESPYYGNLNRAPYSAYALANTIGEVLSWGGLVSIVQPIDQTHEFKLYEIAKIADGEVLVAATTSIADTTVLYNRYCIVVAEAEIDPLTGLMKNIAVCTFCPNFIYLTTPAAVTSATFGHKLYLNANLTLGGSLADTASGSFDRILAVKTGAHSIFFSGTANVFGV